MKRHKILLATLLLGGVLALSPRPASAQQPYYPYDRGDGIPTSLLGTYVRKGELLAYSFYEYTRDSTNEYKPSEMGFKGPRAGEDFFGKLEQHEFLLFFAYGFTDWLAVEFESAVYTTATLKKAKSDTSTMPKKLREDGLGDTEMQIRLRWLKEGIRNRIHQASLPELARRARVRGRAGRAIDHRRGAVLSEQEHCAQSQLRIRRHEEGARLRARNRPAVPLLRVTAALSRLSPVSSSRRSPFRGQGRSTCTPS